MKRQFISVAAFEVIDGIAHRYGIKDCDWALTAFGDSASQTRISELRRLAVNANRQATGVKVGRQVTVDKVSVLTSALVSILGRGKMLDEVIANLAKVTNPTEQLTLLSMACDTEEAKELVKIIIARHNDRKDKK